jgi:hypothetical protein
MLGATALPASAQTVTPFELSCRRGSGDDPRALEVHPVWLAGDDPAPLVAWRRKLRAAVRSCALDAGHVNFIGEEGEEWVRGAYALDTYQRLAAVTRASTRQPAFASKPRLLQLCI